MSRPRLLQPVLAKALDLFPAVLVTGPRQSGKTTLVREMAPGQAAYLSLDDPLVREVARSDPNGLLVRYAEALTILDEVQHAPELLTYLKLRIDQERHRVGRFLLTGSQQFGLMAGVSESLAGRVAILELLPFSLLELPKGHREDLATLLWNGFYPEPALYPERRDLWLSSYVQTYVERDVRQLVNVQDLAAFETFLSLVAARHSQVTNFAELARDSGVTLPTAKSWLGVLTAGYLVYALQPYFENLGKRLVRSAKVYLLDSALAMALTRQPSPEAALAGSMAGAFFEGWVVSEAVKAFTSLGRRPDLYFWRSHDGLEVDLLVDLGGKWLPVEIKLTATPTPRHAEPLTKLCSLFGDRATSTGLLVCRVNEPRPLPGGHEAMPWQQFPAWLMERLGR